MQYSSSTCASRVVRNSSEQDTGPGVVAARAAPAGLVLLAASREAWHAASSCKEAFDETGPKPPNAAECALLARCVRQQQPLAAGPPRLANVQPSGIPGSQREQAGRHPHTVLLPPESGPPPHKKLFHRRPIRVPRQPSRGLRAPPRSVGKIYISYL